MVKIDNTNYWDRLGLGYIIILLTFFVNPFFASILSVLFSYRYRKWTFLLFIVLFLSLFNITINPNETDYSWYLPLYSNAFKLSLNGYLLALPTSKEPLYFFSNYILAHLFGGSRTMFSIFSTSLFYVLMLLGLKKTAEIFKCRYMYFWFSTVFLLFFPYIFANSANLLRQYWATGVVLFSLPYILSGNRKYWLLAISAFFFHTSSGIITLLAFIPFFRKPLTLKTSLVYFAALIALLFLSTIAASFLPFFHGSALEYALTKVAEGTTFETEYTMRKFVFSILAVSIPVLLVNLSKLRNNKLVVHFFNIQLFLLLYIAANLSQAELCERLNIYLWCFIPYNVLILFSYFHVSKAHVEFCSWGIILLFIVYELYFTSYTYLCSDTFLVQPMPYYFFQEQLYLVGK